jgi:hypothetical protein
MIKKKVIIGTSICMAIACFVPAMIYFIKFHSELSDNPADWANFGSYMGGVLTPIIGLSGILAATYVALIAHKIQQQLVKPVANIIFGDYDNIIYVNLKNGGLGPLIVKKMIVCDKRKKRGNNLIDFMPPLPHEKAWTNYCYSLENKVIPPSGFINLIKIKGDSNVKSDADIFELIRNSLSLLTITLEYVDVFDNHQFPVSRSLESFGSEHSDKAMPLKHDHKSA